MVSTRGVKLKFTENERVLCYEPDPTKAKVLYDSKVLDVVINKDQRGRKNVEYLIHFQGWNSSWDRYVSEEYVLKDTPENRQLQKDLAEKSQLQLGAYLYRRDRKKHGRKTSERTGPSSDDGSSGSPTRMDTDDGQGNVTSSSEDESSVDDEAIPIELTQELKEILELDYDLVKNKKRLLKLPAEPNIVQILESYWRHYCTNQINDLNEKPKPRFPYINQTKRKPEDVQRNLNLCKEVLDGIRIYFDFLVNDILLYKLEQGQVQTAPAVYTSAQLGNLQSSNKNDYVDYLNNACSNSTDEDSNVQGSQSMNRRRTLRSSTSKTSEVPVNGGPQQEGASGPKPTASNNNPEMSLSLPKALSWKLLPDHVYSQQPPPPCLVYGAIHLTRLFVKMPEVLAASTIEENKLKVLLNHLDPFIDFINDHKEWFGEKFYMD